MENPGRNSRRLLERSKGNPGTNSQRYEGETHPLSGKLSIVHCPSWKAVPRNGGCQRT